MYTKMSIFFVGIVCIAFVLLYCLTRQFWRISEIVVVGAETLSKDAISQSVTEVLSSSYFHVVPKNNSFLYPKKQVLASMEEDYLAIRSVTLKREGLKKLVVTIEERHPIALWCLSSEECYYIDNEAFAYEKAPSFSGDVYIHFEKENMDTVPLGQVFLPAQTYIALSQFLEYLVAQGKNIQKVTISNNDTDATVSLFALPELRITVSEDMTSLADKISLVLGPAVLSADELSRMEYIDFRFGKKIYYRYRGKGDDEVLTEAHGVTE